MYDELIKLFHSGQAVACFELLEKYKLLQYLFPQAHQALQGDSPVARAFIVQALKNTDARVNEGKPITPAFLYAAMLWQPVLEVENRYQQEGLPPALAMQNAMSEVISGQVQVTSIPRRFSTVIRDIWYLQHRFSYRNGRRARSLLMHPKFRAAYDFYCLQSQAGYVEGDGCEWWTHIQTLSTEEQDLLLKPARHAPKKRRATKKKNA